MQLELPTVLFRCSCLLQYMETPTPTDWAPGIKELHFLLEFTHHMTRETALKSPHPLGIEGMCQRKLSILYTEIDRTAPRVLCFMETTEI